MPEYIEREALIARWKAAMLHMVKSKDGQHPVSIETLIEDLKLFPAADVAPVVRCKDCIYYEKTYVNGKGFRICPASRMDVTDMDFCSYGERK